MSKVTHAVLSEIASLNPRDKPELSPNEEVSFVPMAAVCADTGTIKNEESREFQEVSKGFTPFLDSDVLVAKITPCFQNGKIAHVNISKQYGFGSTEFHVVRPNPAILDARYAYHFLRQPVIRIAGERRMTGSAGQRRVPKQFLAKLKIPIPPLAEQKRIAEVLDRAEALRARRRAALALLDELTQSIFLEMFGDPTVNHHKFPEHQLSALIREEDKINYGVVQPGDNVDDGVPLVRVGDLQSGRVRHDDLKRISPSVEEKYKRSRLVGDEILVSCVGSIGVVALVQKAEKDFNIARAVARIPLNDSCNREFVAEYLRSDFVQRYFTGELRTVSQPTLNIKQIGETIILLPLKEHQYEFAKRILSLEKLRSTHKQAIERFDELFISLQSRAFKGELFDCAPETVGAAAD